MTTQRPGARFRPVPDLPQHVKTRYCRRCKKNLPLSHYTAAPRPEGSGDWICNTCYVSVEPSLFMASSKIDRSWSERADLPCKSADPELFFPDDQQAVQEARWAPFCAACPVIHQCAEFGRQTGSVGVWGGVLRRGGPPPAILRYGKCSHGHKVTSENDLVFVLQRGQYYGLCGYCYDSTGHRREKAAVATG